MVTQLFLSYLKEIERDPQTDNTIEDFLLLSGFLVTLKLDVSSPKVIRAPTGPFSQFPGSSQFQSELWISVVCTEL